MKERKLQQGKPSWTAEVSAAYRAAESDRPENERVCYDPVSKYFLRTLFQLIGKYPIIRNTVAGVMFWYAERVTPGNPGYVVSRTRYIDDYLSKCIGDGIRQLVILGAGYDTRAYRFDELKDQVKVFEVDHPATQELKIRKVKKLLGTPPDHVVYVAVDFDKEKLQDRMIESGYAYNVKTLFIWEGVVPYITEEGVNDTLAFASSNSNEGSSIIFDYIFSSVIDGTNESEVAKRWKKTLDDLAEPFLFGIEEGDAAEFLTKRGFAEVNEVRVESLRDIYFKGKNKNRKVFPFAAIVHATVKPREGS
jgi:methyltransferase (TIGR00027 family)